MEFTCITADSGYSVGDVVTPVSLWNGTVGSTSTFYKNNTTVGIVIPTGYRFYITNKSTGLTVDPTLANWSYRFRLRVA